MKTKLLFSLALCFGLFLKSSTAQTYTPFPDSNAVWNVLEIDDSYYPDSTKYNTVHYALFGDTIINATSYSKLFYNDGSIDSTIQVASLNTKYHGALRQDIPTKKIYYLPKDSTIEVLIYDFAISVGDTVFIQSFGGIKTMQCWNIHAVLINNQFRNVYIMQVIPFGWLRWIEGIGNSKGLLYDYDNLLDIPKELLCFWDNTNLIYHLDSNSYPAGPYYDPIFYHGCYHNTTIITNLNEFNVNKTIRVYPNPLTHSTLVSIPEYFKINKIEIDIFDLQERKIKSIRNLKGYQLILNKDDFKAAGVYFVRIKNDKYLETIKLLVQ